MSGMWRVNRKCEQLERRAAKERWAAEERWAGRWAGGLVETACGGMAGWRGMFWNARTG